MKYTGGCHCGKVRFSVETNLATVISCNCSHCHMRGLVLTFVPESQFELLTPEAPLTTYHFNTGKIDHLFCPTCGIEAFGRGTSPDGSPTYAINVRCLDGLDFDSLTITPYNGKDV